MKTFTITSLAFSILLFAPPVCAEDIGQIKKSVGAVSINRSGKDIPAAPGTRVHTADTIVTGTDGSVGVMLSDDSLLSAGPNSRLDLSQYGFNTTTHQGHLNARLHGGTLSMVSGKLAKQSPDAVRITTPTAVLAVRGTEFFVEVDALAK
jgi:hypothetical protein